MAQRLEKYWKTNYMSGWNKASFQSGKLNFNFPVRAIKRKAINEGYEVKHCFPSSSKMQTESLCQMKKGHGPGKCNATPLPTNSLQFVVRNHFASYQKLRSAPSVVLGEGLLMEPCRWNEDSIAMGGGGGGNVSKLKGWELIFSIFPGISTSLRHEMLIFCSLWPYSFQNNNTKRWSCGFLLVVWEHLWCKSDL